MQSSSASFRAVIVSEPTLHSSSTLSEHLLGYGESIDCVIVLGPFKCGDASDHDVPDTADFSCDRNECPRAHSALVDTFTAHGDTTSIICQLENTARVIYAPRVGDPLCEESAPQFTVFSTNASGNLVEAAPGLFVTGAPSAGLSDAISTLRVHAKNPSLIFMQTDLDTSESTPVEVIARCIRADGFDLSDDSHVSMPPRQINGGAEEMSLDLQLQPLGETGCFVLLEMTCCHVEGSEAGTWQVHRAEEHCFDVRKHSLLPLEL